MSYAVSNSDEGFDKCGFRTSREAKAFGRKQYPGETIYVLNESTLKYVTIHPCREIAVSDAYARKDGE